MSSFADKPSNRNSHDGSNLTPVRAVMCCWLRFAHILGSCEFTANNPLQTSIMVLLVTAMDVIHKKCRLSVIQAWYVLYSEEVFSRCKSIWDAACAAGSNESWLTHIQRYCKRIVTLKNAPPDIKRWAERLKAARFLSLNGYPQGGKPHEPPQLSNVTIAK
jgi:hypothetical protein